MYCNSCGALMSPEQSVCSRCGAGVIDTRVALAARTRVAAHLNLLGIFWVVLGVIHLIPAVVMVILSGAVGGLLRHEDPVARALAPGVLALVAVLLLVSAALKFTTGWGLLKARPWGRTVALVMAFLELPAIPFGTALGVFTLVVLLPTAAGDEYRKISAQSQQRTAST